MTLTTQVTSEQTYIIYSLKPLEAGSMEAAAMNSARFSLSGEVITVGRKEIRSSRSRTSQSEHYNIATAYVISYQIKTIV